jgi:hypothetical protein
MLRLERSYSHIPKGVPSPGLSYVCRRMENPLFSLSRVLIRSIGVKCFCHDARQALTCQAKRPQGPDGSRPREQSTPTARVLVRPCSSCPKPGTQEYNLPLPLPGCQDTHTLRTKAEGLRPIEEGGKAWEPRNVCKRTFRNYAALLSPRRRQFRCCFQRVVRFYTLGSRSSIVREPGCAFSCHQHGQRENPLVKDTSFRPDRKGKCCQQAWNGSQ